MGTQSTWGVWRRVRACADYHGALPSPSIILRAESRCNCVKPEIQSDVRQQTIKVISLFISFLMTSLVGTSTSKLEESSRKLPSVVTLHNSLLFTNINLNYLFTMFW